ncbi:MAG: sulfatase [Myxococcota bacterium]
MGDLDSQHTAQRLHHRVEIARDQGHLSEAHCGSSRADASPPARRRRLRACRALALALASWACGGEGSRQAPLADHHFILINVDTLRADHLGHHGYHRATSPFLDSLAEQAVVFERAIANSSFTRESVAALLTGQLPSHSGSVGWRAAPAPGSPQLGELFRAAGYRTAFLSNTVMLRHPGFTRGFDVVQHLPKRWDLSGAGRQLSKRALEFARGGSGPFLLYLHYLDPHAPYRPAPRHSLRFAERTLPTPAALYTEVLPQLAALRRDGFGPGDPRFEDLVLRYDAEIAATDEALALLFRGLAEAGLLERSLVVITADHGEEFLEHGFVEHGWTLYQESIHVPLMFWAPPLLAPARIEEPVSLVDVLPSALALLGIEPGDARLDGAPLFATGPEGVRPRPERRPQIAEVLIPRRNVARALILGDWKYVSALRWHAPELRHAAQQRAPAALDLRAEPVREELYHLGLDPGETENRIGDAPRVHRELRALLDAFVASSALDAALPPAPAPPPEDAERLRALGYLETPAAAD